MIYKYLYVFSYKCIYICMYTWHIHEYTFVNYMYKHIYTSIYIYTYTTYLNFVGNAQPAPGPDGFVAHSYRWVGLGLAFAGLECPSGRKGTVIW